MPANMALLTLPPLSLYIHIPWCVQKCPYCDFNSHQAEQKNNTLNELDYVETLKNDLQLESQFTYGRKLSSIFFGGGTPSLFSASAIGEILTYAVIRPSLWTPTIKKDVIVAIKQTVIIGIHYF